MALVVEDGTAKLDAESYISVADADTYHAARANVAWDAVGEKEAALRKATDYMLQTYRDAWKGVRMKATQALDWPRAFVYAEPALTGSSGAYPYLIPDGIVPVEVQRACAELALRAASGELNADLERAVSSETVGPISVTYEQSSPQYKRYRSVDMLVARYLTSVGCSVPVGRS